ncbi:MAG: hypothetical protein KDJ27_20160 [Gammaproteobacteria bacterium]|nr:hypothetical protein [Gammaproteobacteria bacterium]
MSTAVPSKPQARPKRSIFLPIALVAAVVVISLMNDVYQGLVRVSALQDRIESLQGSVADANKVRLQFDALAKGVALLADSGNANAAMIMGQLKKAGVNVDMKR